MCPCPCSSVEGKDDEQSSLLKTESSNSFFNLQGNEEFEKQVNYWKLQVAELAIFLGKTRLVSAA